MTVVQAKDVELDYERGGAGEPLLAIMGMSGTSLSWGEPFLAALRESFDTIVYDHRGVGSSSPLTGALTTETMARDAAALLDALGLDSAHVLGISMGGMIAQELTLAHPERVRTLTLGCTYCGGEGSALAAPEVIQRLGEAMMSGDRARAIRTGWEVNVSASFAADDDAYADFLARAERRAVAVEVIMAQMQACAAHDTNARLAGVSAPTLVVHGTEDRMLPVENGRLIASLVPGARLEVMDGVGHLFFWERPRESAQLIAEHARAAAAA